MRPAILICLFGVSGYAANAQFSILPQLGLENSKTAVSVNKQDFVSPLGGTWSPQAAMRFDYTFKKGHGPFVGLATSRSIVKYDFSDLQTAMTAYTASRGKTQLRFEGGYQVSTKPIYFTKAATTSSVTSHCQKSEQHMGCNRSVAHSGCGNRTNKTMAAAKPKDTRTWMRIQPSAGVAYVPGAPRADVYEAEPAVYRYNAGNWTTAFVTGVGFEFGKGTQRKYIISLNYLKGLGNLDTKNITTLVGNKPTTTSMKSTASSWNVRMGIPISFGKKQSVPKHQAVEKTYNVEKRCGQYMMQYHKQCSGY